MNDVDQLARFRDRLHAQLHEQWQAFFGRDFADCGLAIEVNAAINDDGKFWAAASFIRVGDPPLPALAGNTGGGSTGIVGETPLFEVLDNCLENFRHNFYWAVLPSVLRAIKPPTATLEPPPPSHAPQTSPAA